MLLEALCRAAMAKCSYRTLLDKLHLPGSLEFSHADRLPDRLPASLFASMHTCMQNGSLACLLPSFRPPH